MRKCAQGLSGPFRPISHRSSLTLGPGEGEPDMDFCNSWRLLVDRGIPPVPPNNMSINYWACVHLRYASQY